MLKKLSYLLVAVLFITCIYYLRYTQPVKIYSLYPALSPQTVDIVITRQSRTNQTKYLHLESGSNSFEVVLSDIEQILFRRASANPIRRMLALPAPQRKPIATAADHSYLIRYEFHNPGTSEVSGSISCELGNWSYVDAEKNISLPLTAIALNSIALGDSLWELAG